MPWLEAELTWDMAAFGGEISLSDCASFDPCQWHPLDLEIFYSTGRCHHLAIALHRLHGHPICVLMETDERETGAFGRPIPHHVFVLDTPNTGLDVHGSRSLLEIRDQFASTVGLWKPVFKSFRSEQRFLASVVEREDRPLRPVTEDAVTDASRVVETRFPRLSDDIRRLNLEASEASSFGFG